jgi:hypothetical protein
MARLVARKRKMRFMMDDPVKVDICLDGSIGQGVRRKKRSFWKIYFEKT